MKRFMQIVIVITALIAISSSAAADVPQLINYQGRIEGGEPPYDITFTIYLDPGGVNDIWSEAHFDVQVDENGVFSVILGSAGNPLTNAHFDGSTRYLGIQVNTDPEIRPLTRITSVPYAFHIGTVDGADGGTISGDVDIQSDVTVSGKATIGSGHTNTGNYAFVAGENNSVTEVYATISGGYNNIASEHAATIGGGHDNNAAASSSTIGGGWENEADGASATISGGYSNEANANTAAVGGGENNAANAVSATVGGGANNTAGGENAVVGGGSNNQATGLYAIIGGGYLNLAEGDYSMIGGGYNNDATAVSSWSTVSGGRDNVTNALYATVGGGSQNEATGPHATVPGGYHNIALGEFSFSSGWQANANHDGCYVWSDPTAGVFASTGVNQFLIRASGGVGIGTNAPDAHLHVVRGITEDQDAAVEVNFSNDAGAIGTIGILSESDQQQQTGYQIGVTGKTSVNAVGQAGSNEGHLGYTSGWSGGSWQIGAYGISDPLSLTNYGPDNTSYALGGRFVVEPSTPATLGAQGKYYIGGVLGEVANEINGGSAQTFVAGVIGIDNNEGDVDSYAGYFDGDVLCTERLTVGIPNANNGLYSLVAGSGNSLSGSYSTICGGNGNTVGASGNMSLVFGGDVYINTSHRVAFFDSDSSGRLGINRDDNDGGISHPIHVGTDATNGNGAHLTADGLWTNASSREFKENFHALDGAKLLEDIAALPVQSWQYKNSQGHHIGPVAEDFAALFNIGSVREDGTIEDKYLAASDVAGVALAAIKELHKKTLELEQATGEIELLKQQISELQEIVQKLLTERQ